MTSAADQNVTYYSAGEHTLNKYDTHRGPLMDLTYTYTVVFIKML